MRSINLIDAGKIASELGLVEIGCKIEIEIEQHAVVEFN